MNFAALFLAAVAPLQIGSITVNTVPIFNAAESAQGSFYRGVNLVHVQTRQSLIRRFLLFKEGDVYDPVKLAETERNLRQFDFLESASVTASEPHDGHVDVTVVTQDAWTTDVTADFSNQGGMASFDFDVTQKDLFGSGSELDLNVEHGTERDTKSIEFLSPAALGPYWNLDALLSKNSDGNEEKLAIERLLYTYTVPWTASLLYDHLLRNARVYGEGKVAALFRQEHREIALSRSHVLRADESHSARIVGGIDFIDDTFRRLPERSLDEIPDERDLHFFDTGYESTGFHFVKLNYVDLDVREQDFNVGHTRSAHLALSPPLAGNRVTWRVKLAEGFGHSFSERSFVTGLASVTTRAPSDRNTIVSLDSRLVTRFTTRYPQALVARARIDCGWDLDRDVQFLADGQNGLRAYPNFAFAGNRRILLNVEHRVFLGRELLEMFGPSVAVFADSGQAANDKLGGMKSDFGVGLRLGIARFESTLIRIDLAYAVNDSPTSQRGPVVSISTSQAF